MITLIVIAMTFSYVVGYALMMVCIGLATAFAPRGIPLADERGKA
jgi:hypothetical protein